MMLRTWLLPLILTCFTGPANATISADLSQLTDLESRVARLNGLVSHHDGPNCYNAASLARGFTDQMSHVSGMELRYHLNRFCSVTSAPAKRGDIVTFEMGDTLMHAAVYWQKDLVFEKLSMAGLNSTYRASSDELYQIRDSRTYPFYLECAPEYCNTVRYRCQSVPAVRQELKSCTSTSEYAHIREVKSLLEAISLNTNQSVRGEYNRLLMEQSRGIKALRRLKFGDPCALFYLSSWASVMYHMFNLAHETSSVYPQPEELQRVFTQTVLRARQHFGDPASQAILREAGPISE